ncbi:hypothetical protein AP285_17135 [Limnospira platensis YZ]|nr:hypothetical protein AP285_17135 [Arthrospira platensis YZ]
MPLILGIAFNMDEQQTHQNCRHQPANHGNQNPRQEGSSVITSHAICLLISKVKVNVAEKTDI